jgi:hypothetical protein
VTKRTSASESGDADFAAPTDVRIGGFAVVTATPTSLADFEPLLLAELLVLRAAAAGGIAKVGYRRPRGPTPEVKLRGEFLAFMARGGGVGAPVVGRQLQIMGACVVGRLELIDATLPLSLWLFRCTFAAPPQLGGAQVRGSLSFGDCALPGLLADGCQVDGDLALNAGCNVDGAIRIARARIGGDFDGERLCMGDDGAAHAWRQTFVADGAQIGGDFKLLGGAETIGELRLVSAQIDGDLRAATARMTADVNAAGARGVALNLDRAVVAGHVMLDAGFSAAGAVRLQQTRIGGDLDVSGADFDAVGDAGWGVDGAALRLDRARIEGTLTMRRLQNPLQGASLADARVGALSDDAGTWGQHHVLDGFVYRRFGSDAPTDAAMRFDWLVRQHGDHVDRDFRPDPWRRAIAVLRASGHRAAARTLALRREQHLRAIGAIGRDTSTPARAVRSGMHALFGALAGYGQRPWRLLGWAIVAWALCGAAYWSAADRFAPSPALLLAAPRLAACRPDCAQLPLTMPTFQPLLYSLDALLPLADLQQERLWAPVRGALAPELEGWLGTPLLRLLSWAESACGWTLALTALVSLTGLADRDRRD